jgi:hypothetical protein
MSKKLMLIAAAIFGLNVCVMAQAPAPKADEKPAMTEQKPADAKMEKKGKKAAKKASKKAGKKAKMDKMETPAAPAAAPK